MSSNFEKSVKGGTKIKLAAPKSKYVEHILLATRSGEAGVAEIFRTLQHRLRDSTWTIVFKSLIVVHLMIREGEPNITLAYLSESPRKLAISNFSEGAFYTLGFTTVVQVSFAALAVIWILEVAGNVLDVKLTKYVPTVQAQGTNIRRYSEYLLERARSFRDTKTDFVRNGQGRLKRQTVDKGLLRETESVQQQIRALIKCDLLTNDVENEISLTAFRLLTMDLLVLYSVMNEGTINVLEHYFEMSRPDGERALNIYKTFSKQTEQVVQFLGVARQYEMATRLEIPKLKHAPTGLTTSLEEYLNDPDFEINRRQYLAQQEAKKGGRGTTSESSRAFDTAFDKETKPFDTKFPDPKPTQSAPAKSQPKGPAPDLIDFFESIEQNQQPMAQQSSAQPYNHFQQAPQAQQYQQTGFPQQQTGYQPQQGQAPQPFGNQFGQQNGDLFGQAQPQPQLQTNFTGAGFGGYTPQPQLSYGFQSPLSSIPQNGMAAFPQQSQQTGQSSQSTNPFRQPTMPIQETGSTAFSPSIASSPSTRQSTNPFAKNLPTQETGQYQGSPLASLPPQQQQQQQQQPPGPAQSIPVQRTGTNPFARNISPGPQAPQQQTASPLRPNLTGSTNPFRQSAFVNQQTGQGWQTGQGTIGGFEQLPTVPVFPRPGQAA